MMDLNYLMNHILQHIFKITLYTFVPNKPFGSLLEISPKNFILLKIFNSEFQEIELWFTDQNSQPLKTV